MPRAVSRSAGVSTPRGTVSTMVKSIRITGSDVAIHTVDTEEVDGDRTEMIILEDRR